MWSKTTNPEGKTEMPPYHHPELPTDMLANFNDLHAEISALPRSRAQSLALTKLDEAFLWAKETTNETK